MFQTQSRRATSTRAVEALYATGHWLLSQERIAQAIVVFRAMIHVAPHDERGWLALGHVTKPANNIRSPRALRSRIRSGPVDTPV